MKKQIFNKVLVLLLASAISFNSFAGWFSGNDENIITIEIDLDGIVYDWCNVSSLGFTDNSVFRVYGILHGVRGIIARFSVESGGFAQDDDYLAPDKPRAIYAAELYLKELISNGKCKQNRKADTQFGGSKNMFMKHVK